MCGFGLQNGPAKIRTGRESRCFRKLHSWIHAERQHRHEGEEQRGNGRPVRQTVSSHPGRRAQDSVAMPTTIAVVEL